MEFRWREKSEPFTKFAQVSLSCLSELLQYGHLTSNIRPWWPWYIFKYSSRSESDWPRGRHALVLMSQCPWTKTNAWVLLQCHYYGDAERDKDTIISQWNQNNFHELELTNKMADSLGTISGNKSISTFHFVPSRNNKLRCFFLSNNNLLLSTWRKRKENNVKKKVFCVKKYQLCLSITAWNAHIISLTW